MDIQPERKISSLHQIGHLSHAITCPKCHSVFVTEKECEACGYQMGVDKLGEPFGLKSFFGIKEEYQFIYPWTFRLLNIGLVKEKTILKYRGVLRRRFETLMTYFSMNKGSSEERKLFLFEAKEIIHEYWLCRGKLSQLWIIAERIEGLPFHASIVEELKVCESKGLPRLKLQKEGILPPPFITKLILGVVFVVGASYLTFLALLR